MDMQIFFLSLPVFSCGRLRCAKTARKQVARQKHFAPRRRGKLDSFDDETLTMPPLQQNDGQPCVGKMKTRIVQFNPFIFGPPHYRFTLNALIEIPPQYRRGCHMATGDREWHGVARLRSADGRPIKRNVCAGWQKEY